jgi:uncharacterized protein YqjF (DUF2071 family)
MEIYLNPEYLAYAALRINPNEMRPLLPRQRLAGHRARKELELELADSDMRMRHAGNHYESAEPRKRRVALAFAEVSRG